MIGTFITDENGIPLDNDRKQLSRSAYQPPLPIMKLFSMCQTDYGVAWQLQHRPFKEFDGQSLLSRTLLDQETFGAFVGATYNSRNRSWRWKGRKNTARDKIMGILAQLLASILIPTVNATDGDQNDVQAEARAMRILLEEHLRRAGYELKFLYMILAALVNPATFVHVEYVRKLQRIKVRLESGEIDVREAVDNLMSGLALNVVPVDEMLLGDFFTFDMQAQPYLIRIRRLSYDQARGIYAGRFYDEIDELDEEGKATGKKKKVDRFDFVQAGKTRVFMATQENQTLYDISWTEGDQNMVQEAKFYYRGEDLEVTWVGGVFMGNYDPEKPDELYNMNPFSHRRMTKVGDKWGMMPIYPFAKTGAEPLDPAGRFAYYKSIAFKEYWDDATLNMANRLLIDGMHLDVIKPILISGISKYDSQVLAPGAVASLPKDAVVSPYQLGPNLPAAAGVIDRARADLTESTIANVLRGNTATPEGGRQSNLAIAASIENAKKMLGITGGMIAQLVKDVGELSIDCIIQHTTVGELTQELPGALALQYPIMLARGMQDGREVKHRIIMTSKYMGREMTADEKRAREWELYDEAGGDKKDAVHIWEINPYQFARRFYTCYVDTDALLDRAVGATRARKDRALQILTSPAVAPFTDQEAVINDFAIEPYGGNDPDRYKRKGTSSPDAMMKAMGMNAPGNSGEVGQGARPGAPAQNLTESQFA